MKYMYICLSCNKQKRSWQYHSKTCNG